MVLYGLDNSVSLSKKQTDSADSSVYGCSVWVPCSSCTCFADVVGTIKFGRRAMAGAGIFLRRFIDGFREIYY